METTHEMLHLDKLSLVQWKIMGTPKSLTWIIIFFNGPFTIMDAKLAPINVRPSNFVCWQIFKETTSNKTTFEKKEKYEHCGRFKVKIHIYFMETAHELLHLDILNVVHWNIM
jgi:hypothetical protein